MEAIIESVDEFYSDNLAQEVTRGMREAASRGFWVATWAPYGYRKVHVPDGGKTRPRLQLDPPKDAVVRRIFDAAISGQSVLDITRSLNSDGIPTTTGKPWLKTTVHRLLTNEAYTGTLVWGLNAKDGAPASPGRGRIPRDRLTRRVRARRTDDGVAPAGPGSSPADRQPLPALRSGLLRALRQIADGGRSKERQVQLLRLSVQRSRKAQRPAKRPGWAPNSSSS